MLIEIKCPDCGKTHFFDISVSGEMVFKVDEDNEAVKQYFLKNVEIKSFVPTELMQKYL